jgi:hypothetical protein
LLPLELGRCAYERGSDGAMLRAADAPQRVRAAAAACGLARRRAFCARWQPPSRAYHAPIDTGALVTGLTNEAAAVCCWTPGLAARGFAGVIFSATTATSCSSKSDGRRVVPVSEGGVTDPAKRFTFY